MTLVWPLMLPVVGAILLLLMREAHAKRMALVIGGAQALALARLFWEVRQSGVLQAGRYLRADGLSALFLINVGLISTLALLYSLDYLDPAHVQLRWFYAFFFLFHFTMVGVCVAASLGLQWIVMEATTLVSAFLVGFYNTKGAVEAGWKYLVVCTVGVAFALFGTIVLYLAAVKSGLRPEAALDWVSLMGATGRLAAEAQLLKLAFVFVVVGYGTKIGFVPMHSWLPDAHSEAPSPVSALLSAALLNCAMYALLRYLAIFTRAIGARFTLNFLLVFGVLSVVIAGLLIVAQRDLKRLLAYSSIEHMGIIAIGVGLGGGLALYGALLHTLNHSIGKALLFFGAGNLRRSLGTSRMDRIEGLATILPGTSALLAVGTLAIAGLPPFGLFLSEFAILNAAFARSHFIVAALMLATLTVVFGAMSWRLLAMLFGEPRPSANRESMRFPEAAAVLAGCSLLLLLGVYVPAALQGILEQAMAVL